MASSIFPAFANVSASSTDSLIVQGVSGKCIRVKQFQMVAGSTATNLTFNSMGSGAGTAISPVYQNGSNGGAVAPYAEYGWIFTNSGESLTATTSSGSTVGVLVGYDLV